MHGSLQEAYRRTAWVKNLQFSDYKLYDIRHGVCARDTALDYGAVVTTRGVTVPLGVKSLSPSDPCLYMRTES